MTVEHDVFETVFNVPMECQACVESVESALKPLDLQNVKVDLASETVTAVGHVSPSAIVRAIQNTGKDAIIRGTGKPNSAAVCILESFDEKEFELPVKGLARIVAVSETIIYVDLTVNGLPRGTYFPQIRASGNLSRGALSTGSLFHAFPSVEVDKPANSESAVNSIGAFSTISKNLFSAQTFLLAKLSVQDLIGRSIVLLTLENEVSENAICGVIARSAGAWENDKQVCSCTGKTVWQEREQALKRGVTS
ncbi:copper chaperone for superoxide dismutase [Metschnikowia aff. pulcherrima]|uniref:Superoxide dismutase 1 copper chaperone n=1 Tax=Metschnikowia aff. pulcherrima TaxID=2163413 RepID=A0A4V1AE41_9ASCO|nr:copper chaperone for superoxide dismutase [Metschnikowia aff. pulcherrima]